MTRAWLALLGCVFVATPAAAQDQRFTISGGLTWLGGYPIGGNTATIRRNDTASSPFTLFHVDASIERAAGGEVRFGVGVTRDVSLEAGGAFARPQLALSFSDDLESERVTLDDERVSQYAVDGAVVWQIRRLRVGQRLTPFATGGVGYLRQLLSDRTAVETGTIVNLGGGVRYFIRGDTARYPFGVRLGVTAQIRAGGIDIERSRRAYPVVNLFGFFSF